MGIGRILDREFGRNFAIMFSGTALSQLIPLAIMPVLTRLYSPEDFGLFALYVSILAVLSVVSSGRYDLAIMLPERDEDSASLVVLCSLLASMVAFIFLLLSIVAGEHIAKWLGNSSIEFWLLVMPFVLVISNIQVALNYWLTRQRRFKAASASRVIQSGSTAVAQYAAFKMTPGSGLILGNFLGQVITVVYLISKTLAQSASCFKSVNLESIKRCAIEYVKFPKYSTIGALCDTGATQLPVFFVTRIHGAEFAGVFSLAFRVLLLPATFISSAISQILFQKIVEFDRLNSSGLRKQVLIIFLCLFIFILPLPIFMWFFGESAFTFVFGEKWAIAGSTAKYLALAIAVRFCISPLSAVMALERNIKKGSYWQIFYFVSILSVLLLARNQTFELMTIWFVIADISMYLLYFCMIFESAGMHSRESS